jgi:antitoxin FitA
MMELSIELNESQFEKLQEKAKHLGILPKQLIKAAVTDLLNERDDEFLSATNYILDKNKELYKRLS